jgi:type IV pilus assembly protein PilA
MKTEFKAKFLQSILAKKEGEKGFTLIELLVVIIIIGILSAIALPSFLNQANKAKQSEAKTNVGSMNRSQQAYFLEKGVFAAQANFGNLGLGIPTQTTNYSFSIAGGGANSTVVTNQSQPQQNAIKAYIGGVQLGNITATSEATTLVVLCEAKVAKGLNGAGTGTETVTAAGQNAGTPPTCPNTYEAL